MLPFFYHNKICIKILTNNLLTLQMNMNIVEGAIQSLISKNTKNTITKNTTLGYLAEILVNISILSLSRYLFVGLITTT